MCHDNQTLLDVSGMPFTKLSINVGDEIIIEEGKLKCKVTPAATSNDKWTH